MGRISWAATAATAIAATALALLEEGAVLSATLGVAVLATRLAPWRLPERPWLIWPLRLGLFALSGWTLLESEVPSDVFFSAETFVGQMCLSEILVQGVRAQPSGGASGAAATTLSGGVFLAACSSRSHVAVSVLAPAYFLAVLLALRGMRVRPVGTAIPRLLRPTALLLALALALGACGAELLWAWRYEIGSWVADLDRRLLANIGGTGFSDTPTLGGGPGPARSWVRVLRVEGPLPHPHLRGLAFDTYAGGAWHPTPAERTFVDVDPAALDPEAEGARARFVRLRDQTPAVFVPLARAGLDLRSAERLQGSAGDGLHTPAPAPWAYEVICGEARGPARPPTATERARCLAVPAEIDPRVRGLAERIVAGREGDRARIVAVVDHLVREHAYALDVDPGAGDPVSTFLLEKKSAHCEYFASAAAILLRCAGVPARYVSGYFAHETAGPEVRVVREQDAHAWVEAWTEEAGWVTVEATPGDGRPDETATTPPFGERLQERLADALAAVRRGLAALPWRALPLPAAALGAAWWVGRWWRRRKSPPPPARPGYTTPGEDWVRLAVRFERLLRRAGDPCPPERTWREHLARVSAHGTGRVPPEDLRAFVRDYAAARFGRPEDGSATAALAARMDDLERRSRGAAP